jgi:hypothetical protein
MRAFQAIAALLVIGIGSSALAEDPPRHLLAVGCRTDSSTCFANFDGGSYTIPGGACSGTWANFDSSSPGGRNALAILNEALLSNKTVVFDWTTCYSGAPTFDWLKIIY